MSSNTNFAVWNALTKGSYSGLTNGNTTISSISNSDLAGCTATIGITTGKWYWEIYIHDNGSGYIYAGLNSGYEGGGFYSGASATNGMSPGAIRLRNNGTLYDSSGSDDPDRWGTVTLTSTGVSSFTDGDIIGFALDYDNKKLWISKNGTFFNSGNPAGGSNQQASWDGDVPIIYPSFEPYAVGTPNNGGTINAGQDSSFAGNKTSGSAAATDSNGYGDFYYTPPTNFLSLNSANVPTSDDIDPAQTDDNYPGKNFNVVTYTGDGSTSNAISNLGFSPDMVWIGQRSSPTANYSNGIWDTNRGRAKLMYSLGQNSEPSDSSSTQDLVSFDSDGFTVGTNNNASVNASSKEMVAWCWKANGGTTSSDSSGDITVTRQSNTAGGFAILTYTGNGSSDQTIAHGLGKTPAFIITKNRSSNSHWAVWNHKFTGNYGQLESSGAWASDSSQFYTAGMTSNFIGVKGSGATNDSGSNMLAYVWSEIEGYSKFGTYTGNGNASGPFVYTGFRPRMIFIKQTDSTSNWNVFDTARDTKNYVSRHLVWDTGVQEYEGSSYSLDILSNGFKIRASWGQINTNGGDYVFGAWGDVPFKYNNTF
jgi:hypothetical protein